LKLLSIEPGNVCLIDKISILYASEMQMQESLFFYSSQFVPVKAVKYFHQAQMWQPLDCAMLSLSHTTPPLFVVTMRSENVFRHFSATYCYCLILPRVLRTGSHSYVILVLNAYILQKCISLGMEQDLIPSIFWLRAGDSCSPCVMLVCSLASGLTGHQCRLLNNISHLLKMVSRTKISFIVRCVHSARWHSFSSHLYPLSVD